MAACHPEQGRETETKPEIETATVEERRRPPAVKYGKQFWMPAQRLQ